MFKLSITHNAENEVGLAAFIIYLRDNFSTSILGATANSSNKHCTATLQFATFNEVVVAVQTLKAEFVIDYRMLFEP